MADSPSDEVRLRATETQMRRALGLHDAGPSKSEPGPTPAPSNGPHRPFRRFVRDGDVPVSVIHREDPTAATGTNQLDAARQTIRSLSVAREQAERHLVEAQNAVRDLQTKLAHERMAKDEAIRRVEAERQAVQQTLQSVQAELEVERDARASAETRAAEATVRYRDAEQRLRVVKDTREQPTPYTGRPRGRPRKIIAVAEDMASTGVLAFEMDDGAEECAAEEAATAAEPGAATRTPEVDAEQAPQVRRRGRPPKVREEAEPEPEFIEWWKPGWKARLP
jgi:AT hook motif